MGGPRAGEGAAFGQPWAAFGQPWAAFPGLTQVVGAGGGKKEEETERAWFLSTGSSGLAQGTRQEPLGTWASLKSSPCQPGFYVWPSGGRESPYLISGNLGLQTRRLEKYSALSVVIG